MKDDAQCKSANLHINAKSAKAMQRLVHCQDPRVLKVKAKISAKTDINYLLRKAIAVIGTCFSFCLHFRGRIQNSGFSGSCTAAAANEIRLTC